MSEFRRLIPTLIWVSQLVSLSTGEFDEDEREKHAVYIILSHLHVESLKVAK